MQIAYTMAPGRGDTDLLLFRLSETLAARGLTICGAVQINTDRVEGFCDMEVNVLPGGPRLRISQDLGLASKGCRLDPAVLETAVGLVSSRLNKDVDVLIINKFGKHEAEGRGFRTAIAEAIGLGLPVLVGVNARNLTAFLEFVGSDAVFVVPSETALTQWCEDAVTEQEKVA